MVFKVPVLNRFKRVARRLLYKAAREQDYVRAQGIMKKILSKVVAEDLTAYLQDVRPKVYLLWGEDDKMTRLADGKLMKQKMPFAELKVFEGVGHRLPYELPQEFAKEVAAFL